MKDTNTDTVLAPTVAFSDVECLDQSSTGYVHRNDVDSFSSKAKNTKKRPFLMANDDETEEEPALTRIRRIGTFSIDNDEEGVHETKDGDNKDLNTRFISSSSVSELFVPSTAFLILNEEEQDQARIVTPNEGHAVVQNPKWDMECHSMIPPAEGRRGTTGFAFLKPKPEDPPQADLQPNKLGRQTPDHRSPHLQGPFPQSMRPIIRILLYLEQTVNDQEVVQDAFDIVQMCYSDDHQEDDISVRQIVGSIFEALVDRLGDKLDLASVVQAAEGFESPRLGTYFRASEVPVAKLLPVKPFCPTLMQLAVAYGAYSSKMGLEIDGMESFVRNGARAVDLMTQFEKVKFWQLMLGDAKSRPP